MIRSCFISDSDTEYSLACLQRDSGLSKSELIRGLVRMAAHPNGLLNAVAAQCRPLMDASGTDTTDEQTDCSELLAEGAT